MKYADETVKAAGQVTIQIMIICILTKYICVIRI